GICAVEGVALGPQQYRLYPWRRPACLSAVAVAALLGQVADGPQQANRQKGYRHYCDDVVTDAGQPVTFWRSGLLSVYSCLYVPVPVLPGFSKERRGGKGNENGKNKKKLRYTFAVF